MPSYKDRGSDFISIAVADDTRIHTQLLAGAMRDDPGLQVVASASSSKDLLAAAERVPIDVVVISFGLDDQHGRGPELLREMRALRPQIKGVVLLDSSEPQDVLECFRAGAKGIFSKHDRLESLCKCIRCVHEGQIWARSAELEHALEALANSPLVRATNHNGLDLLSVRERQVIQYLAAGMTNREIADALGLSRHTVKNYLFRIFDKLGVSSRTELLYRTMNHSQPRAEDSQNGGGPPSLLEAAEAGNSSAQLRLAELYGNAEVGDADPVAAYMWYLVSEETLISMHAQIENGKKKLAQSMSPRQVAESERRAAEWLKAARNRNKSSAAEKAEDQTRTMAGVR